MLLRDWRAGELRVLALALVLAVGGVSSVAFFADRVRQALTREAHQVLGADMLMTSDHAWAPEFRDEIVRRGLQRAESMNFVSMVRAGNETLLAAVKAVTPGYPLRGRLRIAPGLNLPDAGPDAVPPRGTVWLGGPLDAAPQAGTRGPKCARAWTAPRASSGSPPCLPWSCPRSRSRSARGAIRNGTSMATP